MLPCVLATTLAAPLVSAQTLLSPGAPASGRACALDRTDTKVLLFAVEDHAASIVRQIDECRTLPVGADSSAKDNHVAYWENLIHPQVASMRDLLDQLMATGDVGVARRISPHVAALEENTAAVIQLLVRGMGPEDRSYPLFLAAASQRAEQIVHLAEMFWNCTRAPMDAEAPLTANIESLPPTRSGLLPRQRRAAGR
jgi:hypothetical protein